MKWGRSENCMLPDGETLTFIVFWSTIFHSGPNGQEGIPHGQVYQRDLLFSS